MDGTIALYFLTVVPHGTYVECLSPERDLLARLSERSATLDEEAQELAYAELHAARSSRRR